VKLAVAFAAAAVAAPVHTLTPIQFGLHYKDANGSSSLLVAWGRVTPQPRLSVLRAPRRPADAAPPLLAAMLLHTPTATNLAASRLALASGGPRLYVVPVARGPLAVALVPDGVVDYAARLPHRLLWLSLEQTKAGTVAAGIARDGVTRIDVVAAGAAHHATLARNGYIAVLPGVRAKQVDALLVTTTGGHYRLPLDRSEFTR
jgi:hypothetical protein